MTTAMAHHGNYSGRLSLTVECFVFAGRETTFSVVILTTATISRIFILPTNRKRIKRVRCTVATSTRARGIIFGAPSARNSRADTARRRHSRHIDIRAGERRVNVDE